MTTGSIEAALDIGSASVKAVAMDGDGLLRGSVYRPIRGRLHDCVRGVIRGLAEHVAPHPCVLTAVTGSGTLAFAEVLDVPEVNEIVAAYRGAAWLVPTAGAALEIGGEHSKFIRFLPADGGDGREFKDFYLNSACSAGSGAFLEQEAHRFDLSIEEFARRAGAARHVVRVAGRCAVFAKTDIVHKHQSGVPLDDIAYSLCLSIAQNVTGELVASRGFQPPLAFVGGVAANPGMRRALVEVLELDPETLVVPSDYVFAGAIGALLSARERADHEAPLLRGIEQRLAARPVRVQAAGRTLPRLNGRALEPQNSSRPAKRIAGREAGLILGIDIGSTTTNVACLARNGAVVDHTSLPTRGQALSAVCDCLSRLTARHGELRPGAVGVTGSGRKFVSEMIGADLVINEITAHAAGCTHFYPHADSIIDIGGQDSKFIKLSNGAVIGFEMNKVCAAGTGSFIEEMSQLLGLDIVHEFAREALRSQEPPDLGERCTVFMTTELTRRLREGSRREDLAAGLCYSIVQNYLSRVVGRHRLGSHVVFQGGVASNAAVVAALEAVTGKRIQVHGHNEVAGAVGAALLARERVAGRSDFRGLQPSELSNLRSRWFECEKCSNRCTIHLTSTPSSRRFFSGGLCDRFEGRGGGARGGHGKPASDLFFERDWALARRIDSSRDSDETPVGIPRALVLYDMLPFWAAFFGSLGINHRFSDPTSKDTIGKGAALSHANTCLPLKIASGHCADLVGQGVRRIFIPSIANLCFRTAQERLDHLCPTVQGWPLTARTLFPDEVELITPRLRFSIPHLLIRDLLGLGRSLGAGRRATRAALADAMAAQEEFHHEMIRRGEEALASRAEGKTYAVILSRSYTSCEPQVQMRLKRALDDLGIVAVPMDMLGDEPLDAAALNGMYWYYGKRILQVARILNEAGDLPVIFLSTFGCGPDSFIVHMLRRELSNVPLLELEVDEHSEFTGIHTRLEAFKYSLGERRLATPSPTVLPRAVSKYTLRSRQLLIPRMSEHAFAFSGAFRSCGVDAQVLPPPDEESLALGKAALGGDECLPCAFVLGDMLRRMRDQDGDAPPPAFFMISGDGPCRLGQYPWLQRVVLDEKGHKDVPIFNASQDQNFYEYFGAVPATFKRRAWEGTVAADVLFLKWRECRARTSDRGAADATYDEAVAELERTIENGGALVRTLETTFDRFDQLPHHLEEPTVTVGLLGENYIRCNQVANGRLAETLEELGAEVWFPSLCEWVYYTNWTARLHCRYEKQHTKLLELLAIDAAQHVAAWRVERLARKRLLNYGRPSLSRVFRLAAPYVPNTFEGETIVGVGRMLDLYERGVGGVIHVAPFGCMVGGIVETLCERISEDLGGFPILNIQYDGRNSELAHGKLEGFVHRAAKWQSGRDNRA
jgi:predicted CoA-substrate-specific enzyme activase